MTLHPIRHFVTYEVEVLDLLARPHVSDTVLSETIAKCQLVEEEHTGVGYFLTVRHPMLPTERIVLDQPPVFGTVAGVVLGFLVFVENNQLTLECFSYNHSVPVDIRTRQVGISTENPIET